MGSGIDPVCLWRGMCSCEYLEIISGLRTITSGERIVAVSTRRPLWMGVLRVQVMRSSGPQKILMGFGD